MVVLFALRFTVLVHQERDTQQHGPERERHNLVQLRTPAGALLGHGLKPVRQQLRQRHEQERPGTQQQQVGNRRISNDVAQG